MSIGRNRRVFHRDLLSLITQAVELDRDRIGDIRVLDNYSFVQVFSEDAQKIIDVLNGYEFRGRKLTVSFSRKKEEGSEDESSDNAEITDSYETQDEKSLQEEV
ncbi:MAG TPA: DbpA RNA binding domain-containing protein [Treponemataceae bacterium]|nr:DbpA RNA binding domain-containing protein [Treponemataceae bacterium]